jgi:hypothetical protein
MIHSFDAFLAARWIPGSDERKNDDGSKNYTATTTYDIRHETYYYRTINYVLSPKSYPKGTKGGSGVTIGTGPPNIVPRDGHRLAAVKTGPKPRMMTSAIILGNNTLSTKFSRFHHGGLRICRKMYLPPRPREDI